MKRGMIACNAAQVVEASKKRNGVAKTWRVKSVPVLIKMKSTDENGDRFCRFHFLHRYEVENTFREERESVVMKQHQRAWSHCKAVPRQNMRKSACSCWWEDV